MDGTRNETINKDFLRNLKGFNTKSRIQERLYHFLVRKILGSDYKQKIIESFQVLDINSDGVLSKTEVIEGFRRVYKDLSYVEICLIVDKLTSNDRIHINFTEFITKVIDRRLLLTEENIKKCFMLIDTNKDNKVSMEELNIALSNGTLGDLDIHLFPNTNKNANNKEQLTLKEFKELLLNN